ncbi:MAG: exonuclease domain-containing protein [Bacteroidia bacterium]|nr:exonuclease domain-containing protein [Bacteroidia bacterium]
MFAIIDIETCGGKFEYRRGHVIEICILIHDGLTVVDKFSTLINPQCYISPTFVRISGITNEMVEGAPTFAQVANKIWEMTKDRIFVAHNVGFDYGFIKEEFASFGAKFKRDTLCTVRLSRKLIPGKKSYSLGNLCESLGIDNSARHRAEGDAVATAKLFDILMQVKSDHPQYKNKGVDELMVRRIDKIKKYILDKLPEECGVYYFLDQEQNIIYIGKSVNAYNRAMSHFNTKEQKGRKMLNDLYNVDFVATGSELIALLLEAEEIKKHKPKYNRQRKADSFTHSIDWFTDEKGIINFKLVDYNESENALMSFTTYFSAREKLESWLDEHTLCLRYCGLTDDEAICFNHQIKKCNGICGEQEEIEMYNKRAKTILENYIFAKPNFVIIDKGKTPGEQSVILIENRHYAGYGYFDSTAQISSPEEFKGLIKKLPITPMRMIW